MKANYSLIFILILFFGCRQTRDTVNNLPSRPNILLILTDQQSSNALSISGNSEISTPSIDYLAMHGVLFSESYCTSPVCAPSRSSIITGRMPHETRVNWNGDIPSKDIPNMGHIFSDAGYNTYWAGKWHLPESYPLRSQAKDKRIPGFEILHFYDSTKNWPEWGLGDTTDAYLTTSVVTFLEQYSQNQPFLLAVSYCNPHDICYVPRRPETFTGAGEIDLLPGLPENFDIPEREPDFVSHKRISGNYGIETTLTRDWTEQDWRVYRYHYFRMTERVDREIGKILETLQKNNRIENTLIVFTSDHGDGQGAHHWAAKLSLYEESAKVPFILSWQGMISHQIVSDRIVSGIDILPTLVDYSGIRVNQSFTGSSLRPVIENREMHRENYAVTELADDPEDTTRAGRMLRTERYKYCIYSKGELREQFFDLEQDPGELKNLILDSIYLAQIETHRQLLSRWITQTNDPFAELLFLK